MKAYLAGPMRNCVEFNFPAFDHYAAKLRGQGFDIVSPAELDRAAGFDPVSDEPDGAFLRDAMARDLLAICRCDAIALMPGWEKSSGVAVELTLARFLKLDIINAETGERFDETILDEAKRLTRGSRNLDYGHPLDDYERTAKLWSIVIGHEVTAEQAILCMVMVKASRLCHDATKRDSWTDVAGYADCGYRIIEERQRRAENAA